MQPCASRSLPIKDVLGSRLDELADLAGEAIDATADAGAAGEAAAGALAGAASAVVDGVKAGKLMQPAR